MQRAGKDFRKRSQALIELRSRLKIPKENTKNINYLIAYYEKCRIAGCFLPISTFQPSKAQEIVARTESVLVRDPAYKAWADKHAAPIMERSNDGSATAAMANEQQTNSYSTGNASVNTELPNSGAANEGPTRSEM